MNSVNTPCCGPFPLCAPLALYFTSHWEISAAQTEFKQCQILHSAQLKGGIILYLLPHKRLLLSLCSHRAAQQQYPVCFKWLQLGLTSPITITIITAQNTPLLTEASSVNVSFVSSLQKTGGYTEQRLAAGHQAQVPDGRVVLRGQVSQTHGQDPRLRDHPGLHEAEESRFRCVRSVLLTKGWFESKLYSRLCRGGMQLTR